MNVYSPRKFFSARAKLRHRRDLMFFLAKAKSRHDRQAQIEGGNPYMVQPPQIAQNLDRNSFNPSAPIVSDDLQHKE